MGVGKLTLNPLGLGQRDLLSDLPLDQDNSGGHSWVALPWPGLLGRVNAKQTKVAEDRQTNHRFMDVKLRITITLSWSNIIIVVVTSLPLEPSITGEISFSGYQVHIPSGCSFPYPNPDPDSERQIHRPWSIHIWWTLGKAIFKDSSPSSFGQGWE